VTLLRLVGGADDARACLGFMKRIDDPISAFLAGPARAIAPGPPRRDRLHAEPP